MSAQPLPSWLADVVEPIVRDLQLLAPLALEFRWEPSADPDLEGTIVARLRDGEALGGWSFPAESDRAYLQYVLGNWLQDELSETRAAWAQALPPCPGHPHPAAPELFDDEVVAWWTCPADGRRLAPFGRLADGG